MDYQKVIEDIYSDFQPKRGRGKVADYIPALAEADPMQYGISVSTLEGAEYNIGDALLDFIRSLCGNDDIYIDQRVAKSEREHADRNMALAYFMKSFGNIKNDIDTLIDVYCSQCAVSMNCTDLARSFLFLVNRGVNPLNGERLLTVSQAKRLGAVMLTCGFYDESGDFAFRAGLPGKSGVGGGIVAYIPGNLSIAVWSPGLNRHGNSLLGVETLERFTTDIGNSIF